MTRPRLTHKRWTETGPSTTGESEGVCCCTRLRQTCLQGMSLYISEHPTEAFVPWWRQAGRQAACNIPGPVHGLHSNWDMARVDEHENSGWPSILLGPASSEDGRLGLLATAVTASTGCMRSKCTWDSCISALRSCRLQAFQQATDANSLQLQVEARRYLS